MQYYRRKPLDDSKSRDRRRSSENLVGAGTRQRTTTPAFVPMEPAGPPSPPAPVSAVHQVVDSPERSQMQDSPVQEATSLVQAAASILDEEMAAGVLAARDSHNSTYGFGTSLTREQSGTDDRLRHDLHAIIDQFADLITRSRRPFGEWLASMIGTARDPEQSGLDTDIESVAVLHPRQPVSAGGSARISLKVHNDAEHPTHLTLKCGDLVSSEEYKIPEQQAVFTPREIQLEPDASLQVTLDIGVPPGTPPGTYSGLLTATGLPYLHAVVTFEVE